MPVLPLVWLWGLYVTSLEHHGRLGLLGSLSALPAPAQLSALLVPPPMPQLCFSLALLVALLYHFR